MTWYVCVYKRKRVVCLCVRELWERDRETDTETGRQKQKSKQRVKPHRTA